MRHDEREGSHGFYQNARRVLELVIADAADAGEVERLTRLVEIQQSESDGDLNTVGKVLAENERLRVELTTARANAIRECVAVALNMSDDWNQEAREKGRAFSDKANTARQIATSLESLTTMRQQKEE